MDENAQGVAGGTVPTQPGAPAVAETPETVEPTDTEAVADQPEQAEMGDSEAKAPEVAPEAETPAEEAPAGEDSAPVAPTGTTTTANFEQQTVTVSSPTPTQPAPAGEEIEITHEHLAQNPSLIGRGFAVGQKVLKSVLGIEI